MSKAVVFFAEGTEECEALLVVDLLRRAKVDVTVASSPGIRKSLGIIAWETNFESYTPAGQQITQAVPDIRKTIRDNDKRQGRRT